MKIISIESEFDSIISQADESFQILDIDSDWNC